MKPMRKRDVVRALRAAGCVKIGEDGRHEKWQAPSGKTVPLPRHDQISAGVIRSLIQQLPELPEGWLQ